MVAQVLLIVSFSAAIATYSYRTYVNILEEGADIPVIYPRYWQSWKEFPERFQKFFEDRIAWKHLQIRRFARFKLDRLGVSPTPRVWVGDDGWFFLNHEADSENYYALTSPKLAERRRQWTTALPEWHSWLKARGIRLLVVVPPNKQSVYLEHLPSIEAKHTGPTPFDVLLNELKERDPSIPLLDLRSTIRSAMGTNQLFFKTDTHWNPYGFFRGYQTMVQALGWQPLTDSSIRKGAKGEKSGDLLHQMGYSNTGPEAFDNLEIIQSKVKRVEFADNPQDLARLHYLKSTLYVQPNSDLPKGILFHDSFGDGMFGELLAQHFSRLYCIPSNHMDPELIAQEKPDVVILEIVERLFQGIGARRPTDPPRRSLNK